MSYRLNKFIVLIIVLWVPFSAYGIDLGSVKVHGYLSQSYIHTEHYDFIGIDTNNGNWEYRELGLNFFYRPTNRSLVAAQISNREQLDATPDSSSSYIDYLILGFNIYSGERNHLNLRLGDMRVEQGLYSTALDVPANRDMVFLPQNLYNEGIRNSFFSMRGFDLTYTYQFDHGDLDVSLASGWNRWDKNNLGIPEVFEQYLSLIGIQLNGYDFLVKPISLQQLKVLYTSADMGWKFEYIYRYYVMQTETLLDTNVGNFLFKYNFDHDIRHIISVEREWYDWVITFEYQKQHENQSTLFKFADGSPVPNSPFPAYAHESVMTELWYLQSRYYFTSAWDMFIRYERYPDYTNDNDNFCVWALGAGWKASDSIKIRADYYWLKNSVLEADTAAAGVDYHKHTSAFGLSVSYQF